MAANSKGIVVAFDLYGTLLSTESIAKKLATLVGSEEKASQIATTWRKYQLEYSWRLTSMGKYDDFFNITRNSLLHTLAEFSVKLHDEDIDGLMEAYDHLSTFPDVIPALKGVSTNSNITAVVFSNGTKTMVSNSVFRSQDLSPHAKIFQHLVTVDEVKKFKPAPEVYHHLAQTTGKEMKDIWLVSANPFDIVGATTIGINAAWVDRAGRGWEDNAVPSVRPKVIGKGVEEIFKSIISQI